MKYLFVVIMFIITLPCTAQDVIKEVPHTLAEKKAFIAGYKCGVWWAGNQLLPTLGAKICPPSATGDWYKNWGGYYERALSPQINKDTK
jgi:hypothetical protein